MRNGSECSAPPTKVIAPMITPRMTALPRPVSLPSSERPSERPMLMPAPSAVASPTRSAACQPAMEVAAEHSHKVPERLKMLAEMKAAMLAGCQWCIDIGAFLLDRGGVPEEQVRALADHRDSDAFDEVEKLVLDYAEGMTRTPVEVSDELFAALREHFDAPQLVELTSIIALENYRARFNWAMGIEAQRFADGAACPMPARADTAV